MASAKERPKPLKKISPRGAINTYYRSGSKKGESPFQPKTPPKKPHLKLNRFFDSLIILIAVICLTYSLIVKSEPQVIATSTIYRPLSAYQLAADKAASSISDHTKLTFNKVAVSQSLQKQFPEISSSNIALPLFSQRAVIRLSIASPQFIFSSHGRNYILAANGLLVTSNTRNMSLPTLDDQTNFVPKIGAAVLSSSQVQFIDQVLIQAKKAKVPISSLVLPNAAQELDLRTKDQAYYVKFYLGGDPMVQIGQFLAARHQFTTSGQNPSQYLDVRVPGKIFYK